jgi:serine/threonine protein kinase
LLYDVIELRASANSIADFSYNIIKLYDSRITYNLLNNVTLTYENNMICSLICFIFYILSGRQGLGLPCLDWPTRLKIVKGIAKGLKHIYNELPSLIAPHGHLKSSNVLLDESLKPLLTDYGLIPVMNQEHAQELMVAYKSPEYLQHGRITKKTDVWSFGILILEILTGKFPANILQQGKGTSEEDSPFSWVLSVVPEGWSAEEVFDKEMGGSKNSEGEMRKLLKIGLACCEGDVEKRWDLKEAVERVKELRENDGDDDFYTSYASEADIESSRRLSADFNLSTTGSVQIF